MMKQILILAALVLAGCNNFAVREPQATEGVVIEKKHDSDCMIGGCSGQLCTDGMNGPVASTCEYLPSYACYKKTSTCERQPDGQCGWTPTAELSACLDGANHSKGAVY